MQAVDHQHVIGAGAAENDRSRSRSMRRGFADERGLHHRGGIRIAGIKPLDPPQRGGAQSEDRRLEARSAAARFHRDRACRRAARGPINMAARREAFVIELAGVLEIADAPHAGFEFDQLSVVQIGRGFAIRKSKADTGARVGRQFEHELIAAFGERRAERPRSHPESLFRARLRRFREACPDGAAFRAAPRKTAASSGTDRHVREGTPPGNVSETTRSGRAPEEVADAENGTNRETTMPAARANSGVTNGYFHVDGCM